MLVVELSRGEEAATGVGNVSVCRVVRDVSLTLTSDSSQRRGAAAQAICDRALSLIQLSVASYMMSCQLNRFSPYPIPTQTSMISCCIM